MSTPKIRGNRLVFCLFKVANIVQILCGVAIASCGIYLWVLTGIANIFDLVFMGTGAFLILISLCSFTLKNSVWWLSCYIWILWLVFGAQVLFTVILLASRNTVFQWALSNSGQQGQEIEAKINSNLDACFGIVGGMTGLTVSPLTPVPLHSPWLLVPPDRRQEVGWEAVNPSQGRHGETKLRNWEKCKGDLWLEVREL